MDDETAKYNKKLQDELEKIRQYRRSVEEEYATLQGKQLANNEKAVSIFADNIGDVAEALVSIATGRHPDAKPATMVKAGMYIYDRVILKDDDPRKSEMESLLERLSTDPEPSVPTEIVRNEPTNHGTD